MKTKQNSSYFITKKMFGKKSRTIIPQNKIFYFTHFRRNFQDLSTKQQERFVNDLKKFFGHDSSMVDYWERKLNIKL